jgi:lipoprotein
LGLRVVVFQMASCLGCACRPLCVVFPLLLAPDYPFFLFMELKVF